MKITEKGLRKLKIEISNELIKNKDAEEVARLGGFAVELLTMVCAITAPDEKTAMEGLDIATLDCKKRLHIMYGILDNIKGNPNHVKN